jgi:CubicO group peptidase (beta-lactamase class C family)
VTESDSVDVVQTVLERAVRAGLAPGWVALACRAGESGRVWCVGRAGVGDGATSPSLLYDLASITKPLATATLLLLARRDGLDLEAPLGELLPELRGGHWSDVTLIQCATHTAGFPGWAPLYHPGPASRERYLDALAMLEPVAPAGARLEYSCPGFIALGLALERGYGREMDELFSTLVAGPLGLESELMFAPPAQVAVAQGERGWYVESRLLAERGGGAVPPPAASDSVPCDDGNARGLGGAAGNAGLFGTAAAVASLASEFLPGGGELLSGQEADFATRSRTAGLEQARGLGWQLAATPGCSAGPALAPEAFGHTGFTGTSVWADPLARYVFVLLGNRLHPGGRTPDLHPLRRVFHAASRLVLEEAV